MKKTPENPDNDNNSHEPVSKVPEAQCRRSLDALDDNLVSALARLGFIRSGADRGEFTRAEKEGMPEIILSMHTLNWWHQPLTGEKRLVRNYSMRSVPYDKRYTDWKGKTVGSIEELLGSIEAYLIERDPGSIGEIDSKVLPIRSEVFRIKF